jgi:hypothetical protein
MNFLLHRHLAAGAFGSPVAGVGAVLPDLWRMADRRARARPPAPGAIAARTATPLDLVLAGIAHHLDSDGWFHRSPLFTDGERATAARLRAAGLRAPRMPLLAHATWELCLDGALVRREGAGAIRGALADGHRAAGDACALALDACTAVGATVAPAERRQLTARMERMWRALLDGEWIDAYRDGAGVAHLLDGIRRRVGLSPLAADDLPRLGAALDSLGPDADGALAALLAEG